MLCFLAQAKADVAVVRSRQVVTSGTGRVYISSQTSEGVTSGGNFSIFDSTLPIESCGSLLKRNDIEYEPLKVSLVRIVNIL